MTEKKQNTKKITQEISLCPQIIDQQLMFMGEELYNAYYLRIYKYFKFRLRSKFDAEDLAQTVFLKVITSLQRKMWDGSGALCYIFVVARNTLIDYFRRKKHACIVSDELVDMVAETVGVDSIAYSSGHVVERPCRAKSKSMRGLATRGEPYPGIALPAAGVFCIESF